MADRDPGPRPASTGGKLPAITLAPGEVVAVVGPPGAGKTALLARVVAATPRAAFVPAGRRIFPSLTVDENLAVGAYRDRGDRALVARRRAHVHELFPRLAERGAQHAGTLSGGEQQLLVIARALMSGPSLLVLDEPTAGLGPPAVEAVAEALEGDVVFAETALRLARRRADRVVLLDAGAVVLDAPRTAAFADERLGDAYLVR
jgi:branched-chain amino acid transport system ATP-binding protein